MDEWYVYAKKADFGRIAQEYGIDPVTARILRNRDIIGDEELRYFFRAGIDDLYDGKLLPDMEAAARAVWAAVQAGKKIRIVGDYDIDGVSAAYILVTSLRELHADADTRIPDRVKDGYGINMRIVEEAAADKVDLILTCDNGIAAVEEAERAAELGLAMVITDHHNVRTDDEGRDILPRALAVVDAKRQGSLYPTTDICGAVTALKLVQEIFALAGEAPDAWLRFLDFAALATVGDVMQLRGENRVIVKEGLRRMSEGTENIGLRALIDELGLSGRTLTPYHIGFVIGPCINAAGRLGSADTALGLFLTDDFEKARVTAGHLKLLNDERKSMTEQGVAEGEKQVLAGCADAQVLTLYIPGLHESLAGIVAGRLKELFYRPCFVITDAGEGLKGSGRSIEAYDMFAHLSEAAHFLTKFGGHAMAAGLSMEAGELDSFRTFVNAHAGLSTRDLTRKIWIDAAMPLDYCYEGLVSEIESLAPFGTGFERPLFADRDLRAESPRVLGRSRNALRMTLLTPSGRRLDAVMFGEADAIREKLSGARLIDVLYTPEINEFMGRRQVQINVRDFRVK